MLKLLRNTKLAGKHKKITSFQLRFALDLGSQFGKILEENCTTVVIRDNFMLQSINSAIKTALHLNVSF